MNFKSRPLEERLKVTEWSAMELCIGCGAEVCQVLKPVCPSCGERSLLNTVVVARRFVTTSYEGWWIFKKGIGYWEWKAPYGQKIPYGKVLDNNYWA